MVGIRCPICNNEALCLTGHVRAGIQPGTYILLSKEQEIDPFDMASKEQLDQQPRRVNLGQVLAKMREKTEEASPKPIIVVLAAGNRRRQRYRQPRKISMSASRCFSRVR